jgi:hypothetical protein
VGAIRIDDNRVGLGSAKVKQVLDSRMGRFDLTRPPSREEGGMAPGRTEGVKASVIRCLTTGANS